MSDKIELKPCPFCGKTEDLQILTMADNLDFKCAYQCEIEKHDVVGLGNQYFVNCPNCGACGPVVISLDKGAASIVAAQEWNRRVVK